MLLRDPRLLASLLVTLGVGFSGYYGWLWLQLPEWSPAEIERSVELNVQIDIQRLGPHLAPTGQRMDELRALVRQEVLAEVNRDRTKAERGLGAGLIALVLGLGQWLAMWVGRRYAT